MTSRIAWIIASCLMASTLLLASCSSTPTTPSAAPTAPSKATSAAPAGASPTAAASEKPKSGGVFTYPATNNPTGFDQAKVMTYMTAPQLLTNDRLLTGDWSRGSAGTNEFQHIYGADVSYGSKTGSLAESYKIVEPGHLTFEIRQGVHFALNPNSEASKLANGREMTADDVVYSLNRIIKENNYIRAGAAHMVANTTVTAPDKETVDIKFPPEDTLWVFSYLVNVADVVPQEVIAKYGDLSDWKNSAGTGPFMLTDYVSGSALTYVKNPNYWDKDPAGPGKGNQLPYLDGAKTLILPDPSTRLTAIRTGKIDIYAWTVPALIKDDFQSLINSTPQLKSMRYIANGNSVIYMRTDKQDLPFKDARVRRAMTMAVDYKSIVDKLLAGDGEYPAFPTLNIPDFKSVYFPLSEATQASQEMYSYNPTKAKQLLADAGYPNGFKSEIIVDATGGIAPDQLSVFKDAWSKIGVDLSIKPMEFAAYNSLFQNRNYDQMIYGTSGSHGIYIRMLNWTSATWNNSSFIDDEKAKTAANTMTAAMATGDQAKADATYKEFERYAMEQQWTIPFPAQFNYTAWWPWVKNYHGEINVGFDTGANLLKWVWLDQDLKKSMGY